MHQINQNINYKKMSANGIKFEDNFRDDCRPNDFMQNTPRKRLTPSSGDSHSMSSSRSSIKSNGSEDVNSVKSQKMVAKTSNCSPRRILQIKDQYCWDCHKRGVDYSCKACLRSYHKKCPSLKKLAEIGRSCPECIGIMEAEEGTNTSGFMQWLKANVGKMAELLEYTIVTVKAADRNNSFDKPVSNEEYPNYLQYIVNPMDLSLVEENVKNKTYASTNSFLADIKWIYHNCFVFNSGGNNALISEAKNIIRVAKQECEEIEICPDCYLNYYTLDEDNYFAAVCARPHAIVWAKLKGHPFWPAKVVRYNEIKNEVDIRFFGTHDKCWLKPENCYLMSQDYPYNKKPSKFDQIKFNEAIQDMNSHLDQLEQITPKLFQFHPKHSVFTADKLYLSEDQNTIPSLKISETNFDYIQSPKENLNTYNGISFKTLKVNASKFDISSHIKPKVSPEISSPPMKRFKRISLKGSPNSKQKCFSNAIAFREEMSSSIESDHSFNDSRDGSKIDRSFSSNISFDKKSISKSHLIENHLNSSKIEANDMNINLKSSPILNQSFSQTVTVSGKSSEILSLSNFNKTSNQETNDNCNQINANECNSSPKLKAKSTEKMKTHSNEELLKKIKSLEFKNRKLNEELSSFNSRISNLEEENNELKKSNAEMESSISDIKKKQWCTHCSKEAILPCCWNTCYCTVECQHQHWPIHSKTCRRRQQQTRT